jgi:hypothetical protein
MGREVVIARKKNYKNPPVPLMIIMGEQEKRTLVESNLFNTISSI